MRTTMSTPNKKLLVHTTDGSTPCLNLVIETPGNLIFCFAVFDETDRQQFGRRCRRLKQGQGHRGQTHAHDESLKARSK